MKIEDIIKIEKKHIKRWVGVQTAYEWDDSDVYSTEFHIKLDKNSSILDNEEITIIEQPRDKLCTDECDYYWCDAIVNVKGGFANYGECDGKISFRKLEDGRKFYKQVKEYYEYEKQRKENPNNKDLKCKWIEEIEEVEVWIGVDEGYDFFSSKDKIELNPYENIINNTEFSFEKNNCGRKEEIEINIWHGFYSDTYYFRDEEKARKFFNQVQFYYDYKIKQLKNKE